MIVRCQPAFQKVTAEQRLIVMEDRLLAMENRLAAVGDRSSRMEGTLETLAAKDELQVAGSPPKTVAKENKTYSFKILAALLMKF